MHVNTGLCNFAEQRAHIDAIFNDTSGRYTRQFLLMKIIINDRYELIFH